MTTLREAAQQALEALESDPNAVVEVSEGRWKLKSDLAIAALRAALAEPVEPVAWRTFDGEGGYDYRTYEDNEDYAAEWAKRNPRHVGWVEPLYTAPPQRPAEPQGCDHCNHPLYAAVKCSVCGRVTEPAQEPVHPAIPLENSREAADAIEATLAEYGHPTNPVNAARAGWRAARLYTAPPQRKPLTDEQKQAIHNETGAGHSLICLVESYINGIKE